MTDPIELFLNRLQHPVLAGIDLKLDRMHRLLSLLGNPHKRVPPVIHVAGTNGKGSLIAYLKAIFEAAGYRAHVYTSPHLVQFRERIVLAGDMIDNAYLEKLARHVASVLPQQSATYFEAATAFAFLAFAEKPADVLLLETGMGGRLDATNVIDKPLLTAITPIAFDHMDFLGDTLAKIAGEKAGILKKDVPCVVGRQQPEAMKVLEEKAAALNAPLIGFDARGLDIHPSLAGGHQYDNAATAIACIDQLKHRYTISDEHILTGIASARWPARLQTLTRGPFRDLLPEHLALVLDGGHNAQGGEVFASWARDQDKPIHAICGMIEGKDASAYMQAIAPIITKMYAVTIPGESTSRKAEEVAKAAAGAGIDVQIAASPEDAIRDIAAIAGPQSALVAIIGSLYLAGQILKNHG